MHTAVWFVILFNVILSLAEKKKSKKLTISGPTCPVLRHSSKTAVMWISWHTIVVSLIRDYQNT